MMRNLPSLYRFILILVTAQALALSGITTAHAQAPAPLFTAEPVNGLCGPLAAHERVLDANGFEETWRGLGPAGARLYAGADAYWLLLVVIPGLDIGCIVAEGDSMEWGRGGRE